MVAIKTSASLCLTFMSTAMIVLESTYSVVCIDFQTYGLSYILLSFRYYSFGAYSSNRKVQFL